MLTLKTDRKFDIDYAKYVWISETWLKFRHFSKCISKEQMGVRGVSGENMIPIA